MAVFANAFRLNGVHPSFLEVNFFALCANPCGNVVETGANIFAIDMKPRIYTGQFVLTIRAFQNRYAQFFWVVDRRRASVYHDISARFP